MFIERVFVRIHGCFDIDQNRLDSTNLTNIITGDTDADRLFGAANINAFTTVMDNLYVGGRVGVVLAKQDIDAVIESGGPDAFTSAARTVEFGQVQVGAEIAYLGNAWEPYATAHYEYEFNRQDVLLNSAQAQPSNDDDGFVVGGGVRYFGDGGWSGWSSSTS